MKYLILITTVASYFVVPRPTLAAELPTNVFLSEVNWAGSQLSNADEWVELTNPLEEAIDLAGWSIEGAATSGGTLVLPDETVIESHSTYLIANYDSEHSTLNTEPNLVTTELALSNSGLGLVLRDGSSTEIDRVGDGGSPPAGFSGTGGGGFASMMWSLTEWISSTVSSGFDLEVLQYGTPRIVDVEFEEEIDVVAGSPSQSGSPSQKDVEEVIEESEALEVIVETGEESKTEEKIPEVAEGSDDEDSDDEDNEIDVVAGSPGQEEMEEIVADTSVGTFAPTPSFETQTLLINEVASAPEDGPEWVEIVNSQSTEIALAGWRIQEAGGTSIELSGAIAANGFAVGFTTNRLNNTGDTIRLIDPSGNLIDEMSYGDGQALMARTANGDFVETTTSTRGSANVITSPTVEIKQESSLTTDKTTQTTKEQTAGTETLSTTLRIVELLPNPKGEDAALEYITLQNFGDTLIDLTGWILTDRATDFELEGALAAGLRIIFPRPITRITLNNDEDSLELLAPDGTAIDNVTYEKSFEGTAYALTDQGWNWDSQNYSDEPRSVSEPEAAVPSKVELASVDVDEITISTKKKSSTTTTTREGTVIALPDTFSSQTMYIDGLQIYQYRGDFLEIEIGDVVRVTGTLSTAYGESRLKITDAEAMQIVGTATIEPIDLAIAEMTDAVGELVRVNGMITERSGDRFVLEDDSGSISVVLKETTEISSTIMTLGSRYQVTGVVNSYNGELRLLPRYDTDIEAEVVTTSQSSTETMAAVSSSSPLPWGYLLALGSTGCLIVLAWQYRRRALTLQHT